MVEIRGFFGEHRWLSNFYPVEIVYACTVFPTVENAYQAAKCSNEADIGVFRRVSPYTAKKIARSLSMRDDWDQIKITVMQELLKQKFAIGTSLALRLHDTGSCLIVEENHWGDTFWGVCDGIGQNHLGEIIMRIREENRTKGL